MALSENRIPRGWSTLSSFFNSHLTRLPGPASKVPQRHPPARIAVDSSRRNIWRFPIGIAPVIIHSIILFSDLPSRYWGTPTMETSISRICPIWRWTSTRNWPHNNRASLEKSCVPSREARDVLRNTDDTQIKSDQNEIMIHQNVMMIDNSHHMSSTQQLRQSSSQSLLWRLWTQRRGATFCLVRSSPCRPQRMGNVLGSMSHQKQSIQVVARDTRNILSGQILWFKHHITVYIYTHYICMYIYTHTLYLYLSNFGHGSKWSQNWSPNAPKIVHASLDLPTSGGFTGGASAVRQAPTWFRSEAPWNIFVCRTVTACHSFLSQTLV